MTQERLSDLEVRTPKHWEAFQRHWQTCHCFWICYV